MGFVRIWWSPVVVGAVVAVLGIGVAEVAGMPAGAPNVPRASASGGTVSRPDGVGPAAVEHHEDVVDRTREPLVTPGPPGRQRPTAEPAAKAFARVKPEPTPRHTPAPRTTPTTAAAPPPTPSSRPTSFATPTPVRRETPIAQTKPQPKPVPAHPAQILDLRRWKLTLPAGKPGRPAEVRQPELGALASGSFMRLTPDRGVAFRAPVGGVTTRSSSYPRSELREMSADGRHEAGWSNATGTHAMTINQAITATPRSKPHVVAGQIHDAEDDVVMIRLEGRRLFVESDGEDVGLLDPQYRLGTRFTVSIRAAAPGIRIRYNRTRIVDVPKVGRGWYFKAGCYPQSNLDRGDLPTAYGEVVIYTLAVRHSTS